MQCCKPQGPAIGAVVWIVMVRCMESRYRRDESRNFEETSAKALPFMV